MNELEEMLAAESRIREYLEKEPSGPYPGFTHDLAFLMARLNLLRAENMRLRVKAKEA